MTAPAPRSSPRPTSQQTWYELTAVPHSPRPQLDFVAETDACVVGGGLAGLTVAHELAARGWSVVLLEADRLGSGASGRNGGFVLAGFAEGQAAIEKRVGLEQAKALYDLSCKGVDYVRLTIEKTRMPGVNASAGALKVVRHAGGVDAFRAEAERFAKRYGHGPLFWPQERVRDVLRTKRYHAGLYDGSCFHIHPLNYCLGLAADAARLGVRIFEQTPALGFDMRSIRRSVLTPKGYVRCNKIILCGSASISRSVHRRVSDAVVPVMTYIGVTEPLGERLAEAIRFSGAVTDTRRAGNYFRVLDGGRILWGAGISTRPTAPERLRRLIPRDIASVFPQLKGIGIDHVWSGTMAYAAHKMPLIGEVERDIYVASGFGGHGLNTTAMAGLVLAEALVDRGHTHERFAHYGLKPTYGALGRMAAQFEYWRLQAQDRLSEWQGR